MELTSHLANYWVLQRCEGGSDCTNIAFYYNIKPECKVEGTQDLKFTPFVVVEGKKYPSQEHIVSLRCHLNHKPLAANQELSTDANSESVTINLTTNAIDLDKDHLVARIDDSVTQNGGRVVLGNDGVTATYTSPLKFAFEARALPETKDQFTYVLNDGKEDSNIVTVTIKMQRTVPETQNQPPTDLF